MYSYSALVLDGKLHSVIVYTHKGEQTIVRPDATLFTQNYLEQYMTSSKLSSVRDVLTDLGVAVEEDNDGWNTLALVA